MWRAVGAEGCERGELIEAEGDWIMRGTILRLCETGPAEVKYEIVSDTGWRTKSAHLSCRDDRGESELRIAHEGDRWYANDKPLLLPKECIDIDLAWSPSTNTLPIRRLNLAVGVVSGPVTAAWIRMPALTVKALHQRYERTGPHAYIYSSRDGSFRANLTVDEDGLVVHYEAAWDRIGTTRQDSNA